MGLFSLLPVLGILLATLHHGQAAVLGAHAAAIVHPAVLALEPGQTLIAAMALVLSIRLTRSASRQR